MPVWLNCASLLSDRAWLSVPRKPAGAVASLSSLGAKKRECGEVDRRRYASLTYTKTVKPHSGATIDTSFEAHNVPGRPAGTDTGKCATICASDKKVSVVAAHSNA